MVSRGQDKETGWAWPHENNGIDTSRQFFIFFASYNTAQTSSEEASEVAAALGRKSWRGARSPAEVCCPSSQPRNTKTRSKHLATGAQRGRTGSRISWR